MKSYKLAAIPGDGIGQEVIAAGLQVLQSLQTRMGSFCLDVQHFDWGSDRYVQTGAMMPPDGLDQLRDFDAIYFGSA